MSYLPIVLFYHQVLRRPRPDHLTFRQALTLDEFRAAMEHVKRHFHPLKSDETYRFLRQAKPFPTRSVLITFDDGFRNNLLAAEILNQLGLSAIFFVLSETLDGQFVPWYLRLAHILSTRRRETCTAPWGPVRFADTLARRRWQAAAKEHLLASPAGRRDAELNQLSSDLDCPPIDPADEDYQFLGPADLRRMRELGMAIGGHSASHDNLIRCNEAELRHEMLDSADGLAAASGGPIDDFSYPDGRYNDRVLAVARQRYRMAFAAECHVREFDQWQIPRRGADDYRDVRRVLSRWYPWRRWTAASVKRLLGEAAPSKSE